MGCILSQETADGARTSASAGAFLRRFGVGSLLRSCGASKLRGVPAARIFEYLLLLVFAGRSMYMDTLLSGDARGFAKDAVYRLVNSARVSWERFTASLAARVVRQVMEPAGGEGKVGALVVDDSVYPRSRSKRVELLARVFDHANGKYLKGFRMLTVGWTDGVSFVPVSAALMSSAKDGNRLVAAREVDGRTCGARRRAAAVSKATEAMVGMLRGALAAGVPAAHVLFDSWFTSPKAVHAVEGLGLHAVGMVKRSPKMTFLVGGAAMDLRAIFKSRRKRPGRSRYLLSVDAEAIHGGKKAPVRLVFVRNRSNRKDWLCILSSDMGLEPDEVVRLYGQRWQIECFFKVCKSYLRLARECRSLSYDAMAAHVAVVLVRYTMLSVAARESEDPRSLGELFLLLSDEVAGTTLALAVELVMGLFRDVLGNMLDEKSLQEAAEAFMAAIQPASRRLLLAA